MKILASAKMGQGTFQAKFIPLALVPEVEKIFVLRRDPGPSIPKVEYILLPPSTRYKVVNFFLTPFILLGHTRRLKPDFLVGYHFIPHALFIYLAGVLTGRKFIFCQTGGECQTYMKYSPARAFIRHLLHKAHFFNVPGIQSLNFWKTHGIKESEIQVLHSTIDTLQFVPDESQAPLYDVLYVGILNSRKRVDWIIRAVARIIGEGSPCRVGIVGKGPLEQDLRELANTLGISENIQFFGFQHTVLPFLQKTKIFAMTSEMEGLPVALMEAMACEKLVIGPQVDNIPSVLIDGVTGFSFEKSDFEGFTSKLSYAYRNYSKLEPLRKAARQTIVDNYSYNVAIKKWQRILLPPQ